jgi:microcystin-dependent protein
VGEYDYRNVGAKMAPLISGGETSAHFHAGGGEHPDLATHTGLGLAATHSHPYASDTHDHDSDYAASAHNHDGSYSAAGHSHAAPSGLAPTGGTTGQVLKKNSNTNYDYAWAADNTGAGGSEIPVGFVVTLRVSTDPGVLLGYGTWSRVAQGRMVVGQSDGDADFDTAGETGGAKTHTLTSSEMPVHTHVQDAHTHTQNSHNHTQDAHSHVITSQTATTGGATSYEHGALDTSSAEAEATEVTNPATATNQAATAVNQNATPTNQSTGGGGAHNNMPPYVVFYMWERTA